jgi:hypothetical protein
VSCDLLAVFERVEIFRYDLCVVTSMLCFPRE